MEAHLGHLRAIDARAFVHVETHTNTLAHRAWKGRLIGYRVGSNSFQVYHSSTRSVPVSYTHLTLPTKA